jgi:hypothetical protein
MDDVLSCIGGTPQNEEKRLRLIAELMEKDPEPDSEDGNRLNALVDAQVEAERHIVIGSRHNGSEGVSK